jgi:hypothetical protein
MLGADALRELADDIAANGQQDPITLDAEGRLLDGRNRLAACDLAGVDPVFAVYEGDPVAFIVSKNAHRRHLSAGQRAMAIAFGMWEQGKWDHAAGRWQYGSVKEIGAGAPIDRHDLKHCGAVLADSRDAARQVMAGTKSLRGAYDEAKAKQAEAEESARHMEELRSNASDLHSHVIEGTLPLSEAYAAYLKRTKLERKAAADAAAWRRKLRDGLRDAVLEASTTANVNNIDALCVGLAENPSDHCTPQRIREAAQQLCDIADAIERRDK